MANLEAQLATLLKEPLGETNADALMEWFLALLIAIADRDAMLEVVSEALLEQVPDALLRAAEGGRHDAWMQLVDWYQDPPLGPPNGELEEGALIAATAHGIFGALRRLVRLRLTERREQTSAEAWKTSRDLLQGEIAEDIDPGEPLHLLGILTTDGLGAPADPSAGFALQERAAELGSVDAAFAVFQHLWEGHGIEPDRKAALTKLRKLAEESQPEACLALARLHLQGDDVARDPGKAADLLEAACTGGNGQACAILASMLARGAGVPEDRSRARFMFFLAENAGFDAAAQRAEAGMLEED